MVVFHQEEIDRLVAALSRDRGPFLLIGPPGMGKTTVARAVAAHPEIERAYGARRFWIAASAARTFGELLAAIAAALGVSMSQTVAVTIVGRLSEAPALLIIDDLELLDPDDLVTADELAADLVRASSLALLVTSRTARAGFSIRWREILRLGPVDSETGTRAFVDIAGERYVGDPRVGQVLDAVGHVPARIELAARRARSESSIDVALDGLRTPASPDQGVQLAAMAAAEAIDMPAARDALAVLELFPNGLSNDVLARASAETQTAINALVNQGLATRAGERVRSDSIEAARPPNDQGGVPPGAHGIVGYYFELLDRRATQVGQTGSGGEALSALTVDASNIEQAIRIGLRDRTSQALRAADLFGNVMRFAGVGSLELLERAVDAARRIGDRMSQAALLMKTGEVSLSRADYDRAERTFDEAREIYREQQNDMGVARCVRGRAHVALACNRWTEARDRFLQALSASQAAGDDLGVAVCTERLADISLILSSETEAKQGYEQALRLYRQIDHRRGEADCLHSLGEIALSMKDYDQAAALLVQAGQLHSQIGNLLGLANSELRLGDVAFQLAQDLPVDPNARPHYEKALTTYTRIGDLRGQANAVLRLGELDAHMEQRSSASAQYHRALELHRRGGNVLGEAAAIMLLADLEKEGGDTAAARRMYREALALYRQLGDNESVGRVAERLAGIVHTAEERQGYVESARAAWTAIGRHDLLRELAAEFGVAGRSSSPDEKGIR